MPTLRWASVFKVGEILIAAPDRQNHQKTPVWAAVYAAP